MRDCLGPGTTFLTSPRPARSSRGPTTGGGYSRGQRTRRKSVRHPILNYLLLSIVNCSNFPSSLVLPGNLSSLNINCLLLSIIIISCHALSYHAIPCHSLSSLVTCGHLLSFYLLSPVIPCQLLSFFFVPCQPK